MKKAVILCLIITFSYIITACGNTESDVVDKSTPATTSERFLESTTEDSGIDIISNLTKCNNHLDTDFAAWLYNNYPSETALLSENDNITLKSPKWRAAFDKSYYVLKDEYNGLINDKETAFCNNILLLNPADSNNITLAFAGDICFEDGGSPGYNYESNGLKGCFSKDLIKLMKSADMFMANNEFTLSDRGAPQENKKYTFRGKPDKVKWLKKMGVDVLSVANNHAYDYGEESFIDTYNNINDAGIMVVGGGMNLKEATTLKYVIIGGVKIAIIAATQIENWGIVQTKGATESTPGVLRCADGKEIKRVCKMIKKARKTSDYVVVYPHWGIEYEEGLQECERVLANAFAKSGADIILGGHPHCIQGVEYYDDTLCCYSLSNFIFNSKSINSTIITINIKDGILDKVKYNPCKTEGGYTWLLDKGDNNYNNILSIINKNSAGGAGVNEDGVVCNQGDGP